MQLMLTPTSPYARIVRIAIMLKSIDSDCLLIWVDPPSNTPELVQANPHARVPTLLLDNGTTLTETQLIIYYLEQYQPSSSLLPNSQLASILELAGKGMGLIDAAFWLVFNRHFNVSDDTNPLIERRLNAIKRTLESFEHSPPLPISATPTLGHIALGVALEYIAFRLPELNPYRIKTLENLNQALNQFPTFQLTAFQ